MPGAHMIQMLTNQILESAGTSTTKLDAAVNRHRTLVAGAEIIPATLFDVEGGAAVIEQLTSRLAKIYSLIEPLLDEDGPQSLLARAIAQEIAPSPGEALTLVAGQLGHGRRTSRPLLLGEKSVYGHPDLRVVTHGDLNHVDEVLVFTRYAVHPDSGQIFPLDADESVVDAANRVTALLDTAVAPKAA